MPVQILVPGSHECLASRKLIMCARNMGVHVRCGTLRNKGIKKQDEKLDSRAAEKGAKKLVSSDYAKILDKESNNKRKQCLLPLTQLELQILSLLLSNRMLPNCQRAFSDIRTLDHQQVFSNTCSPDYKQRFSEEKKKSKLLAFKMTLVHVI
jgi:hypothetical protein